MDKILTLSEAAQYLRVASVTLYRMARRGEVPAVKFGRGWRFHHDCLSGWMKEKEGQSGARADHSIDLAAFRHISTRETKAVLEFIKILKDRYAQSLTQVILYGSRARGDFKAYSDIDLLVLFAGDEALIKKIKEEVLLMTSDFNLQKELLLQVFVMQKQEWEKPSFKTFLLVEKIKREGIVLYGSKEK